MEIPTDAQETGSMGCLQREGQEKDEECVFFHITIYLFQKYLKRYNDGINNVFD